MLSARAQPSHLLQRQPSYETLSVTQLRLDMCVPPTTDYMFNIPNGRGLLESHQRKVVALMSFSRSNTFN